MRSSWTACFELRSRALVSLSVLLIFLISILTLPHQTHAVNEDSIAYEDHNHPQILDLSQVLDQTQEVENYEPDFLGVDRSIIGRAEENDQALANNAPGQLNIEQGGNQFWTFPKEALFGPVSPSTPGLPPPFQAQNSSLNQQSSNERTLYISFNTCLQPTPKASNSKVPPEQLKLYVSTNPGNKNPNSTGGAYAVPIDEGFGSYDINVTNDVFFGISAPNNDGFSGVYNYQLTASIDGPYASYYDSTNVSFIDSDTSSALLYTNNLTSDNSSHPGFTTWMNAPPPFTIFIQNKDNPSLTGLNKSMCALQDFADVQGPAAISTSMTLAGDGTPKQQLHVRTLNASSSYNAILAVVGNSTKSGNGVMGGGGIVWDTISFKTKSGMMMSPLSKFSAEKSYAQMEIAHCSTI